MLTLSHSAYHIHVPHSHSPPSQPLRQTAIPGFYADRHLHLPKGILAHEVRVSFVYTFHEDVGVGHARVREQEELGAREGLEDGQSEKGRLEGLDP